MSVLVLAHQGIGNVIAGLPLIARLVERHGADGVRVLVRPAAQELLAAAGVTHAVPWRGAFAAVPAARAARAAGAARLVALPPIAVRKAAALAACSGLRLVRARRDVPLHGAHPISEAMQALAETLDLPDLDPPRLSRTWCARDLRAALMPAERTWLAARVRVAIHLGSDPANDHKRWSLARFREVVMRVAADVPGACFALVGGERELARELLAGGGAAAAVLDLTGRTSLREAARFVADADAMLSGDSGLMHLAAALAVPVFAVFGPTSEACWFPTHAAGRSFSERWCPGPCYPRTPARCRRARCVDEVHAAPVAAALLAHLADRAHAPRQAVAA